MSRDLSELNDFVENVASKGLMRIGDYLRLKDAIYRLDNADKL